MTRSGRTALAVLLAGLSALAATSSLAKDDAAKLPPPPSVYRQLIDCKAIADPAARLACFDTQVAALEQAQQRREVVIVDQAEVRDAKKGLFGLSLPRIKLFDTGGDEFTQIETTIGSARQYTYGRWRIVLADGAVWDQIDEEVLASDPRAGDKIVIKRAAMGSYKASVKGQPSIRVRRVN
jgi:hypothetical protein